jgi:hypothetical protein
LDYNELEQEEAKDEVKEIKEGGIEVDFSEPDSPDLVFVQQEGSKLPIVKGGTTEKLIDRLVPEKYPGKECILNPRKKFLR